jgi:hypothetical protein
MSEAIRNYEAIKRCVSGAGWENSVITPSCLQVFEGIGYYKAWEVINLLLRDGIIQENGLHQYRRLPVRKTEGK